MITSPWILLRMRNVSNKIVQKIKTRFIFSNFSENIAVYETMWKNTVEPDRPQMTKWCMRFACWIPKATHARARTEYASLILIAFPLHQWLRERASMLRHTYIACFVWNELQRVLKLTFSGWREAPCADSDGLSTRRTGSVVFVAIWGLRGCVGVEGVQWVVHCCVGYASLNLPRKCAALARESCCWGRIHLQQLETLRVVSFLCSGLTTQNKSEELGNRLHTLFSTTNTTLRHKSE